MSRKARIWIGTTLLAILALNYAIIGVPLSRKSQTIKEKYRTILIKQVRSGEVLKNAEDEYLLDVFRKEKVSIDRKMLLLNCVSISLFVVFASWTIFGVIMHRDKRKK